MARCSKCGAEHQRNGRYCHACHAGYQRDWRKTHPPTAIFKGGDFMINITNVPVEYASPRHVKIFEQVTRLVANDAELAGSIAANLLIDIIFTRAMRGDIAQMDNLIDALAASLKVACRECIAADRVAGHA